MRHSEPRFFSPRYVLISVQSRSAAGVLQKHIAQARPRHRDILDCEAVAAGMRHHLGDPAAAVIHADLDHTLAGADAINIRQLAQLLDQMCRVAVAADPNQVGA